MASVSWFSCLQMRPTPCHSTTPFAAPITTLHQQHHNPSSLSSTGEEGSSHGVHRRQLLVHTAAAAALLAPAALVPNASALNDVSTEEDVRIYTDDVNKFKIAIPPDWQVGIGEPDGFKSITAFYPQEASNSNVSVAITGVGPDFTKMESFGKVEEFAETLIGGLDRSWQRPPGVAAKLIDCKSSKASAMKPNSTQMASGFYYIEYSLQNPGESRRTLYSAIGMASNGWYNRLYTVTGQFVEEETDKYASKVKKAVASFRFI
ncbi:psbP domain-containing protein 3, chloroplastic-like isoform X1 [Arachis stenosperma]|uniref:psbP domain-containing protein 3, chloroplastic-like isoform X1 n=1 Tax=Arachis stenosperma TaxID=217475 RepID=UPI0025AC3182|nr:psbP domain-containing protein 3, chloroplastic-like isoform X1 [Arachis stenosperma]